MRRLLNPFFLILTALITLLYAYAAYRLTDQIFLRTLLAAPFFFVWLVPVLYWGGREEDQTPADRAIHLVSYLSMGWLSFLFGLLILHEMIFAIAWIFDLRAVQQILAEKGGLVVFSLSLFALIFGFWRANQGPSIREVDIPVANLVPALEGFTIVQITDLHVGPTIGKTYVEQVVRKTLEYKPDLIALTGDIVDGRVAELTEDVSPLAALGATRNAYLALGNHDYYSGASEWTGHFQNLGIQVLLNSHVLVRKGDSQILVAGVIDPAAKMTDPSAKPDAFRAMNHSLQKSSGKPDFHLLLAHNPKIAAEASTAGFDLQISGHTHAGQFFPWTLIVKLVHKPHYWGLSQSGRMWVYVSAGTGSWGPPIRFGTKTELTVLRLRNIVS